MVTEKFTEGWFLKESKIEGDNGGTVLCDLIRIPMKVMRLALFGPQPGRKLGFSRVQIDEVTS